MLPTHELVAEHDNILKLLDVLDRLGALVLEGGVPPDRLEAAVFLVRDYADGLHHAKEEQILFPLLEKQGIPRDQGPIGCMLEEHEVGRDAVAEMTRAISDLRAGKDAGTDFADAARGYTDLLRNHIEKENAVLFPWAESLIGEEERAQLKREFALVESEEIGPERIKEMLAVLTSLCGEFLA